MYKAATSCKDIFQAPVTNWEPHGVMLGRYCYTVRHRMQVQLITLYLVSHLQCYSITVHGNVTGGVCGFRSECEEDEGIDCEDMETVTLIGKGKCA